MSVTGSVKGSRSASIDLNRNGNFNHGAPPGEESEDDRMDVDHDVVLDVILPDGSSRQMTINSNIPMMDLLVHAAASSRLSPVGHVLVVRDNNGAVREFRPNQSIGSLGVDTIYLQPKGAKMEKKASKGDVHAQPFEITNRLIINLPQGQKMVLRVSPLTKLSEIFTIICSEKGLDSFVHELRHPKRHDEELDLEKTLQDYKLNEVRVINIKAPQSFRGSDDDQSLHSTNTSEILPPSIHVPPPRMAMSVSTSSGNMAPIIRGRSASPEKEHKKKKGFKALFKKKEKKSSSHHFSPPPAPVQDSNFILRKREPNKTHDPSFRNTMPPDAFLAGDGRLQHPDTYMRKSHENLSSQPSPSPPSTLNKTKKRAAPLPPGGVKNNLDGSGEIVTSVVGPMHQASLGTQRASSPKEISVSTSLSPLSASSGVSGSVDFNDDKRSKSVHDIHISGAREEEQRSPKIDMAAAGALAVKTSKVVKKKRRAPPPPQSPTTPTQNGDVSIAAPPKPPRAVSMYAEPGASLNLDVDTKAKRPCSFIAPPPPDTPPPEDVPVVSLSNGTISKSVSTSFSPDVESKPVLDVEVNGDEHDGMEEKADVRVSLSSVEVDLNDTVDGDDDDDNDSHEGTIDDVNLAFENVIAEAEQVMDKEKVYTHQTEMARFVESMRDEAEGRAKMDTQPDVSIGDDVSLEQVSESDTVIHHGSEAPSEVSSALDASGHISMSLNVSGSLDSPKVSAEEIAVEETITAHMVAHEESAPNYSLEEQDASNMDDHTEDVLANSNVTADSGISQSYDRQADNFIEEIDSAFDSINFDLDVKKIGATTTVGVTNQTDLTVDTDFELRDDLSKGTVSDIDTPPIGAGSGSEVLETEYDGDVSADNGVMDLVMTPDSDKNISLGMEPTTPRTVAISARAESPVMVKVKQKRVHSPTMVNVGASMKPVRTESRSDSPVMVEVGARRAESPTMVAVGAKTRPDSPLAMEVITKRVESPTMVAVGAKTRPESPLTLEVGTKRVESPTMVAVGAKTSGQVVQDSSPELPRRLLHESSPKDVVVESKPKGEISDSFGVKLRHKEPESHVIFESDPDTPKAEESMVKVRTKEKKIERVSIVRPTTPRDSKVFTIGKEDEVFDFEKIRQKALAAQKEKKSGSKKQYGVAGSRPKSEIQKQTTELSFKPNGEGEAEHVLEEKSIMMMSRPKEIKPVEVKINEPDVLHPKMVEPDPDPSVKFKSSTKMELGASSVKEKHKPEMIQISGQRRNSENEAVKQKHDEVDMEVRAIPAPILRRDEVRSKNHPAEIPANRPMSLATLMAAHLPPKDDYEQKHEEEHVSVVKPVPEPIPTIAVGDAPSEHSTGTSEDDPDVNNQLDMLKAQFSNFQRQFQVNESLLSKQKILGREPLASDSDMTISEPLTPQPPESPSEVGTVRTASVPVPPPFIIKADVKPMKKTQPKRFEKQLEPREELMIAIRNVGGRNALRKVPVRDTNWGVKVIK